MKGLLNPPGQKSPARFFGVAINWRPVTPAMFWAAALALACTLRSLGAIECNRRPFADGCGIDSPFEDGSEPGDRHTTLVAFV